MSEARKRSPWSGFMVGVVATLVMIGVALGGAVADRIFYIKPLDFLVKRVGGNLNFSNATGSGGIAQRVVTEESAVIDVAEKASPAVVTVSITAQSRSTPQFFMDPFGIFGNQFFGQQTPQNIKQDIGSGFIVDAQNGLIVTNKHVVDTTDGKYRVITKDDKEYEVKKIYRDPVNDLAILKVDSALPAQMELGDSTNLKVGQFVIAIGTALGEFRHTVTTGVISGLGRGIDAGDGFGSAAERLDNVIQTDAAINPGNSGGPLLNSAGQVIGVNVAVASGGQNIGFALPINVVKESLTNFNSTGQFNRPYLGVRYQMITRDMAIQRDWPEGAYIVEVVDGSPAASAGIEQGDIITKMGDQKVTEQDGGLALIINKLKIGQKVQVELDRNGEKKTVEVTIQEAS